MNSKTIVEKLKRVIDPETGMDVVSMGLIRDLKVDNGRVSLKFRPSSPVCPLGFQLAFSIYEILKKIEGIKEVDMEVTDFLFAKKLNELLKEYGK